MNKIGIFFAIIAVFIGYTDSCMGYSVKEIRKEKEFYKRIEREPFSVVMFYKENKSDPVWQRNLHKQKNNFRQVSNSGLYRNGDVQFLEVDVSNKRLINLPGEFHLSKLPAFMLFKYGKSVRAKDTMRATLAGFSKQQEIKNFINKYLRNQIQDYIESQAERKAEDRARREASGTFFTYGVGYPYYDPLFYDYPYYYPGPSVGFGVSVGF